MKTGSRDSKRANFFERMEKVCSALCTIYRAGKFFRRGLCGVAVVRLDDAAELLLASNATSQLRSKGFVQNLVVHADTPMWSFRVIVPEPRSDDIVELLLTEAHEVIEAFVFERSYTGEPRLG